VIIPTIRPGSAADLSAISAIQARSPEASQWDVAGYLQYDLRVAVCERQVEGFLVSRAPDNRECEILNLAVSPEFRRKGIARCLLKSLVAAVSGPIFLEVRLSNQAAINMYNSLGFKEISRRPGYYDSPVEPAIVMKFHSC
jgi:ribosomal-protein-alanine acetyltransferase